MNKKVFCPVIGFFLGMGAPVGSLVYRVLFSNERGLGLTPFLIEDTSGHLFFYVYMTLGTIAAFLISGFVVGVFYDRLERQNRELETTNNRLQDLLTRLQDSEEQVRRCMEEATRSSRWMP